MKQSYLKPLTIRLVAVLLVITATLVIHSCKKDKQEEKTPAIVVTDPVIAQAKQWYNSAYPAVSISKQATQSIGTSTPDWSTKFLPNWIKANAFSKDGVTYIELPAIKKGDMAMLFSKPTDSATFDFNKSGTLTNLIIVKNQNSYSLYAMTILADTSYLKGDYSKLTHNSYQKLDTNFTGAIFFNRMDGVFLNGWRYRDGRIVSWFSPYSPPGSQAIQSVNSKLKVNVLEPPACDATVTVTLWEDCSYYENNPNVTFDCYNYTTTNVVYECGSSGGGGGTGGGGSSTPPAPPCKVPPPNTDDSINTGVTPNVTMPPPGGGNTTPQPCAALVSTQTITDNVTNPCLHSMVEATISAKVVNQVNSLIQSVFGSSTIMNITFVDAALPSNVDGLSVLPTAGVVNGAISVTIQLDNTHLPSYSQQYIARVIMHEALHAYIVATSGTASTTNILQHESMMQNYVVKMATSLQQMFPGLSTADAQNLALGGLQDAPTFITTIETNLGLLGSFEATNLAYSIGSLGDRCN